MARLGAKGATEDAAPAPEPKRVVWIKKNQIDSTAALTYGLGVSLVHLALFVLACSIERPDVTVDAAKVSAGSFEVCEAEANNYDRIIRLFIGMHVLCFISTVFREFFSAEIGLLGQMMRIVEVLCVPFYLFCLVLGHEVLALILVRNEAGEEKGVFNPPADDECFLKRREGFLCDKCPRDRSEQFSGRALEFFFVEIMVYSFYLLSMVLYMLKSRCSRVGDDIGTQFEPQYLAMMANKIASMIDLNVPFPKEYYVQKERMIKINSFIEIKMILDETSFDELYSKRKQISKERAPAWIKNNVVGRIAKRDLDTERIRETNVLDMMQNTSILSHPESIIEMQIIACIFFYAVNASWEQRGAYNYCSESSPLEAPSRPTSSRFNYEYCRGITEVDPNAVVNFGLGYHDFSLALLIMALVEHILTYIFAFVKKNDLMRQGEIGSDGIESTSLCKALDGLSFFLEAIIGLLVILHLSQLGEHLHSLPLVNYYLIIDLIVSLLLLPYCYIAKRRQVSVNIMKNIFTLNAVQKVKQAERRAWDVDQKKDNSAPHDAVQRFKTYFKDQEAERAGEQEPPKKKTRVDNKPYFYSTEQFFFRPDRKIKMRRDDPGNIVYFSAEQD